MVLYVKLNLKATIRVCRLHVSILTSFFESYNKSPYLQATGKVWARIPDSDASAVEAAVAAAKSAFPAWSKLGIDQRGAFLKEAADLLEKRLDEFANFESLDQGKPVKLARNMDIPRLIVTVVCLIYFMWFFK